MSQLSLSPNNDSTSPGSIESKARNKINSILTNIKATFSGAKNYSKTADNSPQRRIPTGCPIKESQIGSILKHIEANYKKLIEMIIRDPEFVKFETKIISSAAVAFMR